MSSTRFPGKVLQPILDVPMLGRQIERVKRSKRLDRLVVATSIEPLDDPLAQFCEQNAIAVFRGSLNDVLDRFYQAAAPHKPDHVVRLTGDCPLSDPEVIDQVIETHVAGGFDYTSNTIEPSYPDGLDVEVMRFACLEAAWREADLPSAREHVTPFLYRRPERFRLRNCAITPNRADLRWTVDVPEDLEFVRKIFAQLYPVDPNFGLAQILELLENHPTFNRDGNLPVRNEGLAKSVLQDEIFLQGQKG